MADGSLGTTWAIGQQRKMESSLRIDVKRVMSLVSCLEMKCWGLSRWAAFVVFAIANDLWLGRADKSRCNLRNVLNCFLVI